MGLGKLHISLDFKVMVMTKIKGNAVAKMK